MMKLNSAISSVSCSYRVPDIDLDYEGLLLGIPSYQEDATLATALAYVANPFSDQLVDLVRLVHQAWHRRRVVAG